MIPAIKILPADTHSIVSADYHLLLLLGHYNWHFALLNKQKNQLDALLGFTFERKLSAEAFREAWESVMQEYPFLDKYFSSVHIVYKYNEAILLPGKEHTEPVDDLVMDTLFGENPAAVVKAEEVPAEDLAVIYRIHPAVYQLLQRYYVNAVHRHYYSMELQALHKTGYENSISVNFLGSSFVVTVRNNRKLQLIQAYTYQTAEDVLYYLLTIAKEYDCNREEIVLLAGGMVEEQSPLFTGLKKYFLNIELAQKPGTLDCAAGFNEYPVHYFHPIFTIATCVS